jgi:hypothetical protein
MVHDMSNRGHVIRADQTKEMSIINSFECYKPKLKLVLRRHDFYGSCLSADWLQSFGAKTIALGKKLIKAFF